MMVPARVKLSLLYACFALLLGSSASHAQTDVSSNKEKARLSYEAFLSLAKTDDPRRPGALRRLADMELERAEELLIDGGQDQQATSVYRHAIGLYQDLLGTYPKHKAADAVYYQLARALEAVGEIDQARDTLTQLVQEFPRSNFVEESEFRRAETWFSSGQYQLAATSYAAVIEQGEKGRSPGAFLEQAWYKHGWSLFKLGDYDQSQTSFLKLLRHKYAPNGAYDEALDDSMTPGSREMLGDALRAMSLGFSYGNGVDDIYTLLDRDTAPGFEHLLFADLGQLYRKEERFQDAAQAYRAFVIRLPNARHSAHMQLAVIDTYREAGFTDQELNAKKEFASAYALDQSGENYWTHHDVEQEVEVVTALKLHLTELTRHYHALAQRALESGASSTQQAIAAAIRWYRAWLGSFPAAPESAETHFLLAELLFDGGKFAQAVDAFEYTAYEYKPHPRSAESAYAALLAYEKHAVQLDELQKSAWERQSIDSELRFADTFKAHQFATAVQTHAAERLFERGELDDALAASKTLLDWTPAATLAQQRTAWLVRGHSFFAQNIYADAEQSYQSTLHISDPDESVQDRQLIVERLAASVYKQAEQKQQNGNLALAVEDYLRVAKVAPGSAIIATAQYDAASTLLELKAFSRATTVLEAFRANYPGHELQNEVTRNLSFVYVETGESAKAGNEMMRLAKTRSNATKERVQAAYQALAFYTTSKSTDQVIQAYEYLINELPLSVDEGIEAREEIAEIYQKMGNESQHLRWVRSIIVANQQAGAQATPGSRTAAAYATLMFAQLEWQPFMAVRLDEPLQENLRLKKQYMEALLKQFANAAEFNISPVTTAATYKIAQAYAEMADALMTSARPAELTAQELEEYEFLLEEQAFPFEEQAIEVHENNAMRVEDGIYDKWVRNSFKDLAQLMPGRYQKTEKGISIADVLNE